MADLDDELRDALALSESQQNSNKQETPSGSLEIGPELVGDTPGVSMNPGKSSSDSEEAPRRNLGLLAALLVAGLAIVALVFTSVDEAAIYSVSTDQLVNQKEKYKGRNVRVVGDLVAGTLTQRKEPCEYRFEMEKNGQKLKVRYPQCIIPDTFKDIPGVEVQVTAEGELNEAGHFDATHIMAKCPSKYEMQQRAGNGEKAPHSMGEIIEGDQNGNTADALFAEDDLKREKALEKK